MAELQRTAITSDRAPQPLGAYSVGMSVNAGKLIYVAGQVGVDLSGTLIPNPPKGCVGAGDGGDAKRG